MAEQWVEISEGKPLREGDVIRLHFMVSGFTYLTAAQVALMERNIERDKRFTMLRHNIPDKAGPFQLTHLTIDVKVNKQPYGATGSWLRSEFVVAGTITAVIIATAIKAAFVGLVIYLTFSGAKQLIKATGEAAEGIEAIGWTSVQIAAALIAVYLVYKYG